MAKKSPYNYKYVINNILKYIKPFKLYIIISCAIVSQPLAGIGCFFMLSQKGGYELSLA